MAKYHVNEETGTVGVCTAEEGKCPVSGVQNHFDNVVEAHAAKEKILVEKHGVTVSMNKKQKFHKNTGKDLHTTEESEHYETKEEAQKAFEKSDAAKNLNDLKKKNEYGNISYSNEEMNTAVNAVADESLEKVLSDVDDEIGYNATPIYPGNYYQPPEYQDKEIELDEESYKEYMNLTVKKFLQDNSDSINNLTKETGYPFTDDRKEASKIIAKDVLGVLDGDEALGIEPFESVKEKYGEEKAGKLVADIYDKAYPDDDTKRYAGEFQPEHDHEGDSKSGYMAYFSAGPNDKAFRKLKREMKNREK